MEFRPTRGADRSISKEEDEQSPGSTVDGCEGIIHTGLPWRGGLGRRPLPRAPHGGSHQRGRKGQSAGAAAVTKRTAVMMDTTTFDCMRVPRRALVLRADPRYVSPCMATWTKTYAETRARMRTMGLWSRASCRPFSGRHRVGRMNLMREPRQTAAERVGERAGTVSVAYNQEAVAGAIVTSTVPLITSSTHGRDPARGVGRGRERADEARGPGATVCLAAAYSLYGSGGTGGRRTRPEMLASGSMRHRAALTDRPM